jgi:hypothetical protein
MAVNKSDLRQRLSESKKRYWQNPEHRKAASERTRQQWKNPEHRRRVKEKIVQFWEIPEHREVARERAILVYSDPGPRQNVAVALKKKWEDPEFRQKHANEKNPFYIDGRCPDPYGPEFNRALRQSIRERDGHQCRNCGAGEDGRRLEVHHIDYNKRHNDPCNLIYICKPCHDKTQARSTRPFWQEHYQTMRDRFYAGRRTSSGGVSINA